MYLVKNVIEKLHASLAIFLLLISTALLSSLILLLGIVKLLPIQRCKIMCAKWIDKLATLWSDANNIYLHHIHPTVWEVSGDQNFKEEDWFLVVANHQSWLDIVLLQRVLNRKIPVLKFFIKDQLKWVPFLGFAWWAMGFPFLKRYSPSYLAKNPHKKGKDQKATVKALKLFKQTPATLMSFVEGTRYTPQKKLQQNSPYQHLLKPRAGGVSIVIDAMSKQITQLLDITIVYPNEHHSLWNFLCRRVQSLKIHVRQLPIPSQFLSSSLLNDDKLLAEFRDWLNLQWLEKDKLIAMMKAEVIKKCNLAQDA